MLIPVILCGGSGTRLWPLSREQYPKQLLNLIGNNTLLQDTILRLQGLPQLCEPLVICNESHRFLVAEQLRQVGLKTPQILLEPVGRNTAPAVAVAALAGLQQSPDALLLVLPADHLMMRPAAFRAAVLAGIPAAQAQYAVTFGIIPTRAETGYGYIKAGATLPFSIETATYQVERFVEKPDAVTAAQYVASGQYYWNSGMFLFHAAHYLAELEKFTPAIAQAARQAFERAEQDRDFLRLDKAAFSASPSDSVDYAVMEHTARAATLPLDAGWSDVGAWSSLWEVSAQDAQGNVCIGDVITESVENCYLRAEHRLLTAVGVRDHVVIETSDAVLVAHKDAVQQVKQIVATLKNRARSEATLHRKVYRPWGSYESIDKDARFQVKRITVNPGESLSLQMHYHRSEHWIVVKGTAKITRNEEEFILTENQSTYIPLGTKHRLENPGKLPLELIEIQSGSYLGEDDIVRFEDRYGRQGENK